MGGVFGPDAVCVVSSAVALAFLQVVEPLAAQGAAGIVLYVSQVSLAAGRDSLKHFFVTPCSRVFLIGS